MMKILSCFLCVFALSCCTSETKNKTASMKDVELKVKNLLAAMTLEEKIGQMIQAEIREIKKGDITRYHIGSVLNGGGAWPNQNKFSKVSDWVSLADRYWEESKSDRLSIPIIWGVDAVHGHNNVYNATLFPHNIGLGAANDLDLMKRIGEITAHEIRVTGLDWNFAPVLAVTRNDLWGRTYESYSEDPRLVTSLGKAYIEGLQGDLSEANVVACAKHYIGDGGTTEGINAGNTELSEEDLIKIHGQGYLAAIDAGVLTVMASFSSFNGDKLHGHKYLVTDVLKDRMGFNGFVVSDWDGISYVKGCTASNCPQSVNAGVDMFMISKRDNWISFYHNLLNQVKKGIVPIARIDDAVTRILRVKYLMGVFDQPKPSQRLLSNNLKELNSVENRLVALEAARKSMVLLKNNNHVLPLDPNKRIVVVGKSANKIENQLGGWSLSWLGRGHSNSDFPNAVSILNGLKKISNVRFDENATNIQDADYAIAVIGEIPYAETIGDISTLEHSIRYPEDLAVLKRLHNARIPTVTVLLSGRVLYVNKEINVSDAFIAAFLPGSEGGDALSDLIFGKYDFSGKLSFSWPKNSCQNANIGDLDYNPLFPFGYGMTFKDTKNIPLLEEKSICSF